MSDARITIRLPQELYNQAKAKAKLEDVTISQILRRCLREWVKDDPPTDEGERPEKKD